MLLAAVVFWYSVFQVADGILFMRDIGLSTFGVSFLDYNSSYGTATSAAEKI